MANRNSGAYKRNVKALKLRNFTQGLGQYFCEYCGEKHLQTVDQSRLDFVTVDHFIPLSKGGTNEINKNLYVVCRRCNDIKADRDPFTFTGTLDFVSFKKRWREIIRRPRVQ